MLLIACLNLALLAAPLQEAAEGHPSGPSSPPGGPLGAVVNSEQEARSLIDRSQQRLYDIRKAGLKSLSFAVPIRMGSPNGEAIHLGEVAVAWSTASEPEIRATISSVLPSELSPQSEAIALQLEAQGRQILRYVNNDLFKEVLKDYKPSLAGLDGELFQVHFEPNSQQAGSPSLDWFFDADAVPVRSEMKLEQGGVSMNISYEHAWQPASATDTTLVLQQLTATQEMGSMRNVITISLEHETVEGLVMLTGYTERGQLPQGEQTSHTVRLESVSMTRADGS
ncbi:MAG: hypothetical protein P8N09_13115 [Planctomycetota bacterium]|jgi:hypothetical protein|nr:hypothetical protein [Planctomycetota bacterium]